MPSAVRLREDFSAEALRPLAKRSKDAKQSRRLLSLAAVRDGMDRGAADKVGGMDRQTLSDCAHRFNAEAPEGLLDHRSEGPKLRLTPAQLAEFSQIVAQSGDREQPFLTAGDIDNFVATQGKGHWTRVSTANMVSALRAFLR